MFISAPYCWTVRIAWIALLAMNIMSAHAQSPAAGERKHGICASCHGIGGRSFKSHYPILAGQTQSYILRQLEDFKHGRRTDPNMGAVVPQLSDTDLRDLAAFFASREPYVSQFKPDAAKVRRGRDKARRAQCSACHRIQADSTQAALPRIRGQHPEYLAKQLQDFKSGRRNNDGGVMQRIARSLAQSDIEDIADYFSTLNTNQRRGLKQGNSKRQQPAAR
jgi:cytochrome c553